MLTDRQGLFLPVKDVELRQLGVHKEHVKVQYIHRDKQIDVSNHLAHGRPVLVVGDSMAGKTRMVAELVRRDYARWPIFIPTPPRGLADLSASGAIPDECVVWLDDLERYLKKKALGVQLIDRLQQHGCVVVATMRESLYQDYQPGPGPGPPEAQLLQRFEIVRLKRDEYELQRIAADLESKTLQKGVLRYGLAEYIGAGYLAVDRYENGLNTHPLGASLVAVAAAWRRAGLDVIATDVLTAIAPAALTAADRNQSGESVDEALSWATSDIDGVFSLLETSEGGLRAFDYIVDYLRKQAAPITEAVWRAVEQACPLDDSYKVAFAAMRDNRTDIAERLARRGAAANDVNAMSLLGALLSQRPGRDAEKWFKRAATAGDDTAMYNLGRVFEDRGCEQEAEIWYRRGAEAGNNLAMNNLGAILDRRNEHREATKWFRLSADHGDTQAMANLGVSLRKRGADKEAAHWFRQAVETETTPNSPYSAGAAHAMLLLAVVLYDHPGLLPWRARREARTWLTRSAEAGNVDAMHMLGEQLLSRNDLSGAESWAVHCADAGDPELLYQVGERQFLRGDEAAAEKLWHRAVERNHPIAMFNLASLLSRRNERNKAKELYRRAADLGFEPAAAVLRNWRKGNAPSPANPPRIPVAAANPSVKHRRSTNQRRRTPKR
jgi:TPR repeat protein